MSDGANAVEEATVANDAVDAAKKQAEELLPVIQPEDLQEEADNEVKNLSTGAQAVEWLANLGIESTAPTLANVIKEQLEKTRREAKKVVQAVSRENQGISADGERRDGEGASQEEKNAEEGGGNEGQNDADGQEEEEGEEETEITLLLVQQQLQRQLKEALAATNDARNKYNASRAKANEAQKTYTEVLERQRMFRRMVAATKRWKALEKERTTKAQAGAGHVKPSGVGALLLDSAPDMQKESEPIALGGSVPAISTSFVHTGKNEDAITEDDQELDFGGARLQHIALDGMGESAVMQSSLASPEEQNLQNDGQPTMYGEQQDFVVHTNPGSLAHLERLRRQHGTGTMNWSEMTEEEQALGCTPCRFAPPAVCKAGNACEFCHYCPKPKRKSKTQRKVEKARKQVYERLKKDNYEEAAKAVEVVDDSRRKFLRLTDEFKTLQEEACKQGGELAKQAGQDLQELTTFMDIFAKLVEKMTTLKNMKTLQGTADNNMTTVEYYATDDEDDGGPRHQ